MSLGVSAAFGEDSWFFSPRRLSLSRGFVENVSEAGRAHQELSSFAVSFTEGLELYETGNFEEALSSFLDARKDWPEYFYTDLMIAITLEARGQYGRSARFYKSYLNKLKKFHRGDYRISSPIIVGVSSGRIESYDYAYEVIDERLSGYGINIRRVRRIYSPPFFLVPAGVVLLIAASYYLIASVAVPYIRKKEKEMHPPEGFWTCKRCGSYSPELSRECVKCGKPHG